MSKTVRANEHLVYFQHQIESERIDHHLSCQNIVGVGTKLLLLNQEKLQYWNSRNMKMEGQIEIKNMEE